MNHALTQFELQSILHYDPATGIFRWLETRGSRAKAGEIAGFDSDGYIGIRIRKIRYLAHRLAWLYMTGNWPKADTDHINRNRSDNRWSNLREATRSQNCANSTLPANASGYQGVSFDKVTGRWKAQIRENGRQKSLGRFTCPKEAGLVYLKRAKELRGEFFTNQAINDGVLANLQTAAA